MSISWKLFTSYLVVIAVGAAVLITATLSVAPITFEQHMMNTTTGGRPGGMMADMQNDVNASFKDAMTSALLVATLAATSAAAIVSAFVSFRITRPIRATVEASQRIASGRYDERLDEYSNDELGLLTASFNRMAASLQETETTRQHLIGDISHELKTPLASIQGYMEGLQDGIIPAEPDTYQQVQRETRRLQRLVHDLQELSRAEAGQIVLDTVPQDINVLLGSAVDWIKPQFEDKGIGLSLTTPAQPVIVEADADHLRQVLLNLLGNALQYTPENGLVVVTCERSKSDAIVKIQDTGIGLDEPDTKRIFERFYRVDKSRSRISGGSGIGLTIARHIVESHHGALWAESAGLNQGSIFHIRLPVVNSPTS